MIYRSDYVDELKKWINKPQIKVLTGIRRSGKSTILQLLDQELLGLGIQNEQILSLNFESFSTEHLKTGQTLYSHVASFVLPGKRHYLLFDEIQEVVGWEKAINSMKVDFDVDIYLTGSNSHLLSSELATYLAGRYVEIPVYTLSYREFLAFRNEYNKDAQSSNSRFDEYVRKGGFPAIHHYVYDDESAYKVIQDIYSSVILRDTIQRHKIRDVELLERVLRFSFDNIGNTFSGKKVADYFKSQNRKTDVNTIYNYLYALEGAFILYRIPRYDLKGKQILKTQEKYFVSDVSLIHATMGFRSRNISGILENIVFLELKRRGYQVFIGKLDDLEIDFIAEKMGKKLYVQVAYKLENESTIQREFTPLLSVRDHYTKLVVTMDEFWKDNINGIQHLFIQDFLLSEDF